MSFLHERPRNKMTDHILNALTGLSLVLLIRSLKHPVEIRKLEYKHKSLCTFKTYIQLIQPALFP